MKIDRVFMSGTAYGPFWRRRPFWERVDRIATVVTLILVAAAGGAAVFLWIAWLCAGGP